MNKELTSRLKEVFNLLPDKDDEAAIIQSISEDIEFKGVRIWILICAIFTASLGLNVNSTAVIIGAMLISPLMNPIVGLGLGLGIYDLSLVRRSLRNLAIMVSISLVTATLYFLLSPLSQAQSELLARTQPTIYDVLIALVGGAAGIFANSAKINKGNILMGVAIATALMPPLCTAGYGISQGSFSYFLGAFYLFTINAIFIALSTLIVVRVMRFSPVTRVSQARGKRIHRWIVAIIVCVAAPSIYTGLSLVRKSIKDDAVNRFVRDYLNTKDLQALRYEITEDGDHEVLDVALLGRKLDSAEVSDLQTTLQKDYNLPSLNLLLRQDFTPGADSTKRDLSPDLFTAEVFQRQDQMLQNKQTEIDSLSKVLDVLRRRMDDSRDVEQEVHTLFPTIQSMRLDELDFDEGYIYLIAYKAKQDLSDSEQAKMRSWLATRLKVKPESITFH